MYIGQASFRCYRWPTARWSVTSSSCHGLGEDHVGYYLDRLSGGVDAQLADRGAFQGVGACQGHRLAPGA